MITEDEVLTNGFVVIELGHCMHCGVEITNTDKPVCEACATLLIGEW